MPPAQISSGRRVQPFVSGRVRAALAFDDVPHPWFLLAVAESAAHRVVPSHRAAHEEAQREDSGAGESVDERLTSDVKNLDGQGQLAGHWRHSGRPRTGRTHAWRRCALIKIPEGLLASGEPYAPDIGRLYWLRPPLLDPDDPEPERPAVVMVVSDDEYGQITIVTRSSTEGNGQFHPKNPAKGLTKDGWFSRMKAVPALLWTPDVAQSIGVVLDETTFAYIQRDFDL